MDTIKEYLQFLEKNVFRNAIQLHVFPDKCIVVNKDTEKTIVIEQNEKGELVLSANQWQVHYFWPDDDMQRRHDFCLLINNVNKILAGLTIPYSVWKEDECVGCGLNENLDWKELLHTRFSDATKIVIDNFISKGYKTVQKESF